MRREAAVTAVVLVLVAGGLVFTDQYIFGNRCGGRIEKYQREPVNEPPPHGVKVGSRNDRPKCGIMFPSSGAAEVRFASPDTPETVLAWYEENFGATYHLRPVGSVAPEVKVLAGIRNNGGRRMAANIRVGPATSVHVFTSGDGPPPGGSASLVEIEVSQL